MANYPEHVEINQANADKLINTIKSSYKQIVSEINGATAFGVANRKAILAQIDAHLEQLGVDVQDFLKTELPQYYKTGANQAVSQLENIGANVSYNKGFNQVHLQAIAALVSDTSRSFGDALQAVKRNATSLLSKQLKAEITQQIATGITQGSAVREATKQIKRVLADEGITALKDRAGKNWQLDTYSEMLFRTKAVEARNTGFVNRMAQNGYDLAQVSLHVGSCPLCAPWQGKVISITGDTPGYPTLGEAEAAGLFHPRCRHAINVISDLSLQTEAYNIQTGQYEAGGGLNFRMNNS